MTLLVVLIGFASLMHLRRYVEICWQTAHALGLAEHAMHGFEKGVYIKESALFPVAWQAAASGKRDPYYLWMFMLLIMITLTSAFAIWCTPIKG